jgi:acyl-ACP thioesterase
MSEFVPVGEHDRRFVSSRRIRLGDARPDGSVRLDALARYAQDIATDDAADSGLTDDTGYWVLRRIVGAVSGRMSLGEMVEVTTFCGGSGARWAERRTSVVGAGGGSVELAGVWVHVDQTTGAPLPVPTNFHEVYGEGTRRRVRARLEHPAPPPPPHMTSTRVWPLRATDFDVLGHVNNTVYWAAVEDSLAVGLDSAVTRIEMEYRGGVDPGDTVELVVADDGPIRLWFTVAGAVRASAALWAEPVG